MSFTATVLRVFVASPGDVGDDRRAVIQAIEEWNRQHAVREAVVLLPVTWEWSAAQQGGDGQSQVNEQQVGDADVVLALFHTKLGKKTPRAESGTAEEIELGETLAKFVHVLICKRPVDMERVDAKECQRLQGYVNAVRARGLTKDYTDTASLRAEVNAAL